ncbi:MAG: DUF3048 domain-containing protein [Patescibacteria group bacterium]
MLKKNKKSVQLLRGVLFVLVLIIISAGCAPKEENKIQIRDLGRENIIFRQPRLLDGVFVDSDKAELIPVAMVIDNFYDSRPPAGINSAAVVYEVPVEAGITRFLAIFDFDSLPEKSGPIRSVRPYLAELAEEYKGLLLHAGGSPEALAKLKENAYQIYNIEAIGVDEKYFWRDPWRKPPFNLYISAKAIENILKNKKITRRANFESWRFKAAESILNSEISSKDIEIKYKEPVFWHYDPEKKSYLRFFSDDVPHLDENGQQISTKNLILQKTKIDIIDEVGRRRIKLDGSGVATIFQEGKKIEGIWRKENGRTKFYDSTNQEIEFIRGNTWIEIIP